MNHSSLGTVHQQMHEAFVYNGVSWGFGSVAFKGSLHIQETLLTVHNTAMNKAINAGRVYVKGEEEKGEKRHRE